MQGHLDTVNLASTQNGTRSQRLELISNRLMSQKNLSLSLAHTPDGILIERLKLFSSLVKDLAKPPNIVFRIGGGVLRHRRKFAAVDQHLSQRQAFRVASALQ